MKLLYKLFMWLGDGLFEKYFVVTDKHGLPLCIMFSRTERDANNAMRQWVEALDANEKWQESEVI